MKKLILIIAILVLSGCETDNKGSEITLSNAGYTSIKTGGYAFFMCKDNLKIKTKFSAINPRGVKVNGAVCCGLLFEKCIIEISNH